MQISTSSMCKGSGAGDTVHLSKQKKANMLWERFAGVRPMQASVNQSQICVLNSKSSRKPWECLCNGLCF